MPIIEFDTKMRGYDPQQVNDAVTNFQDTLTLPWLKPRDSCELGLLGFRRYV